MSDQIKFLVQMIDLAKAGNENAVPVIRNICRGAADAAPVIDLIKIAECLVEIGKGFEREWILSN